MMEIPAVIANLKLCMAFKGHNPNILHCITLSNDEALEIIDDESTKSSRLLKPGEVSTGKSFHALNPHNTELCLLSIDNCFLSNIPGGIADCALFDEYKFLFIEFKTNAEGKSHKSVEATYREAMGQLENTLNYFQNKISSTKIDFKKHIDIICFIVVAEKFPRVNAMEMSLSVEFATDNLVDLSFENSYIF